MQKYFFLIIFQLLINCFVSAQNHSLLFKNITLSNGLPVDEVTALAQDSSGFIWVGTREGLYRYDGFSFKNFSYDAKLAVGSSIKKIMVDRKGRLWVCSTDGGVSCISNTGKLLKVYNSTTNKLVSEKGNFASDITEDREGDIWWTSIDGLFCLHAKDSSLDCYRINTTIPRGNAFNCLTIDDNGKIWIGGILGLRNFNTSSHQFEAAGDNDTEKLIFAEQKDVAALAFQKNLIWYSNWMPALGNYNKTEKRNQIIYSGAYSAQPEYSRMANRFYVDSKGGSWIGTGSGLYWIKSGTTLMNSFLQNPLSNYSLVNDWVNDILEDREGNFWFATRKGISVARPYAPAIMNITASNAAAVPFSGKEVSNIISVDSNTLLVGTQMADGIYQTDLQFNVQKHWGFNGVGYDWIWKHYDDVKRNRIFISTQEGMLIFDKKTRKLEKAKDTIFKNFFPVSSFVSTSDSIVWMSRFYSKLMKYNLVTGAFKVFDFTKMGEKPQVLFLAKDQNNNLWIKAHNSGLWRFDEKKETIVERIEKKANAPSMPEPGIFSLLDLGDKFLLGYISSGISIYDKKTKAFRHIRKENGLASNIVTDAIQAKDGTVWIATRNGLSHYDPKTEELKSYNYESGILHNDFNMVTQLDDGRIAAGSTMGLVSFFPDVLVPKEILSPPIITEMNIYGRSVPFDAFSSFKEPVSIGYGDNYFSFEYISLFYKSPQQVEYAYKLEGLDDDWVRARSRRFVSYSRVPGGDYTLRLRARLPNGNWVENNQAIQIHVQTAFYKRWWFYLFCFLLVALVVYSLFLYRLQQVLKVERMRTAISSDLHDEVGASLTSISLFSEMARQSTLPDQKKEEYLQRIGERSRDSIDKMSDIIWSINPENDSLQQMLVRMKNYAAEITEAKDISLEWTQSGNFAQPRLTMEQRKNFYLFFKEALNNAVKHAGASLIHLHLNGDAQKISLKITDNGKGFHPEQNGSGNGLKNMKRRAEKLNGNLNISSSTGNGTTVQLEFES